MQAAPPEASSRVVRSYDVRFHLSQLMYNNGGPPTLADAVDLHTHAMPHREDPFSLGKRASQAGMAAIVYKDLASINQPPGQACRAVQEKIYRWAEGEGSVPVTCFFGARTEPTYGGLEFEQVRTAVEDGARCIWFPVISSAYNLYRVGAPKRAVPSDKSEGPMVGPMPWEEALRCGQFLLDEAGKLKLVVREILRLASDRGIAVSFAHSSKPEMEALAEECNRLNYKQALIDHPYGPHIGLEFQNLVRFAEAGISINFTYDEISPLLGVDPQDMVDAIQALGPEHFTLSSDGGNELLPAAVDALQTLANYMRAYGLSNEVIRIMLVDNPRRLLGLSEARAA